MRFFYRFSFPVFLIRLMVVWMLSSFNSKGYAGTTERMDAVKIIHEGDSVTVYAKTYCWKWSAKNDRFALYDSRGNRIVSGPLQPVVLVNSGKNTTASCSAGRVDGVTVSGNRLSVSYSGVNGMASLKIGWRFSDEGSWFEPIDYRGQKGQDVVRVYYFSAIKEHLPVPALESHWVVQPGISAAGSISPVQPTSSRISMDTRLGTGASMDQGRVLQQWGLPSHFFCGMNLLGRAYTSLQEPLASDAFCCGLADLPAGDLRLVLSGGFFAPVIDMRSDLWGQVRGDGPWRLGATFYWSVATDYRQAVRQYYKGLLASGLIKPKHNSVAKNKVIAMPEFNTWGAELALLKAGRFFDQAALETIYSDFCKSGMKAKVFVIDDKWQEEYGKLEHSSARFPKFEEFLDRLRKDGMKIGLWAAFLRCENPSSLGLDSTNMLRDTAGRPLRYSSKPFYYLDLSQPKVQEALRKDLRLFMQRYKPDIVKFDFGYELPSVSMGGPADPSWAGERYLKRSLEIIIPELRKINPDVVVMYYALSPLYNDAFDLHSTDDLFLNEGEFELQANYRIFFSSLLGEMGIPSYGSGGYTWTNMDEVWFDSAPSGSLGSLGSFKGFEGSDSIPSRRDLSKFNGLAALSRTSNVFSVEALYSAPFGANAGRTSSWIRREKGEVVLAALRTHHIVGGKRIAANYKDQIHSDIMVVVASRDEQSITVSNHLGVVPFADGKVVILHEGPERRACVKPHYFDGTAGACQKYVLQNKSVTLLLSERSASGKFVEWYEVDFEKCNIR